MQRLGGTWGKVPLVGGLVMIGLLACLPIAVSAAGESDPGKQLYQKYCSSCHGMEGKADGTVAPLMKVKPTDLTQIAKKAGGEFPTQRMMLIIDGSETIPAHGDSNMPVWGEVLQKEAAATSIGRRAEAYGKLMLITDYLRSIQAK